MTDFCPNCDAAWPINVEPPIECGYCDKFIAEVKIGNWRQRHQ